MKLTENGELWVCDRKMFDRHNSNCATIGLPNAQFQIKDSSQDVGTVNHLIVELGLKPGENVKLELREWPKE
jgi:hypothetical protein